MIAYYTVVYRIDGDSTTHNEWWQSVRPLFMADDLPVIISAVSKADEITRLQCIENIAERRDGDSYEQLDEIRDVIVHPDPHAWWLDNVESEK